MIDKSFAKNKNMGKSKSRLQSLIDIEKEIKNCSKCGLCETSKNAVPGEGNPNSKIIFIGEAPGAKEDLLGRPFVGRAGKLLELLLDKIGYKRSDVWIGNIVKHRPPQNRDPFPAEISACKDYLTRQIEIIDPKLIVTLGRFSMNYFMPDAKISESRGKIYSLNKYRIYPVYHPAAGLRNSAMKEALESDFLKIPSIIKSLSKMGSDINENHFLNAVKK